MSDKLLCLTNRNENETVLHMPPTGQIPKNMRTGDCLWLAFGEVYGNGGDRF